MNPSDTRAPAPQPFSRRELLKGAAGGALMAAGMIGCGGGGGKSGGGGGGGALTPEQFFAAHAAILAYANTVADQPRDTRIARIGDFLKTRAELLGSGIDEDGVWGIYRNGISMMFIENREPEDVPPDTQTIQRAADVPGPIRARVIQTLGPGYADERPYVRTLLSARGYNVVDDLGTVESLRNVAGDGVFYMAAHGANVYIPILDANGFPQLNASNEVVTARMFGTETATVVDSQNVGIYWPEMRAQELGVSYVLDEPGPDGKPIYTGNYNINANFVDRWMNFGANSLVWFSVCHSNSPMSSTFVDQCIKKKAGLYVGWTARVGSPACVATARFILDRMLGSNLNFHRENPRQRPFDYVNTWNDLRAHNLEVHPSSSFPGTTKIVATPGAGTFGLLAPSIEYVGVNEFEDKAVLKGLFGTPPPNERSVLIGGIEANVAPGNWTENQIICDLPRTGQGSAGDVQVWVRGHESNKRRITEWNVPLRYSMRIPEKPPLKVSGPLFLRFRADVGDYREQAHAAPVKPLRGALPTRDSSGDFLGSGSFAETGCTTSLEGQHQYPMVGYDGIVDHTITARFKVDTHVDPVTGKLKGAIGLGFSAFTPSPFSLVGFGANCGFGSAPFPLSFGLLFGQDTFPSPDPNGPPIPLYAIQLEMDKDTFGFPSGILEDLNPVGADGVMRLEWDSVLPNYPPDPQAARSAKLNQAPPIHKVIGRRKQ